MTTEQRRRVRARVRLYFELAACVAIVVAFVILYGNANRSKTLIEGRYQDCIASIPVIRQINKFVEGAETVADVLLFNAEAMHSIAEPGTDVYRTQTANIRRLRKAIEDGSGVRIPVPTRAICEARRDAAL